MRRDTRRRAFTLVELLVVIAIISILAGMLFAVISMMIAKKDQRLAESLVARMYVAMAQFHFENREYPPEETNNYITTGTNKVLTLMEDYLDYNREYLDSSNPRRLMDPWDQEYKYDKGGDDEPPGVSYDTDWKLTNFSDFVFYSEGPETTPDPDEYIYYKEGLK